MSEVLALKYRPNSFDEIIGQESTVKQLQGALEKGALGHALLLHGTRGTGKTTTARIVARELNKAYPEIYGEWDTRHRLVLNEIDAASNNGVDNIREIIDNIRYQTAGHKIIILDEAHMLSRQAFNAFLKTLEEPPERVTFILLTTEPHKLPATIRSRCQSYEFQEVGVMSLYEFYLDIVKKEKRILKDNSPDATSMSIAGGSKAAMDYVQEHYESKEE